MEKATGRPLAELIQERVLDPLGLTQTSDNGGTPAVPAPVQHSFTSERREFLKIPADVSFSEESTYWNPSWTLAHGAIQTSTIDDVLTTAEAIGTGKLLTPESFQKMTSTELRGFGHPQKGCPTCARQTEAYTYGIGLVLRGDWYTQNPAFAGHSEAFGYLPERKAAVAIAMTYDDAAFNAEGSTSYDAVTMLRQLSAIVAPDNPVP